MRNKWVEFSGKFSINCFYKKSKSTHSADKTNHLAKRCDLFISFQQMPKVLFIFAIYEKGPNMIKSSWEIYFGCDINHRVSDGVCDRGPNICENISIQFMYFSFNKLLYGTLDAHKKSVKSK